MYFHLVSCPICREPQVGSGFSFARIRQNVHANVKSVSRPSIRIRESLHFAAENLKIWGLIWWWPYFLGGKRGIGGAPLDSHDLRVFWFGWFDFWCSCPFRSPFYCTMDLALQSYEERSCHCGGMCSGKLGRRLDLVEAKVLSLASL